jgi:hypothetical protein
VQRERDRGKETEGKRQREEKKDQDAVEIKGGEKRGDIKRRDHGEQQS